MENFTQIINSEMPVVVDFYADWCGPCQTMMPIVKEVAEKFKGKARVLKINIDKNQAAAQHYGVRSVPTFMIFKKANKRGGTPEPLTSVRLKGRSKVSYKLTQLLNC